MWKYKNHSKEKYISVKKRVEKIAVELGAVLACTRKKRFTSSYTGKNEIPIIEEVDINIYKYRDVFFEVESVYQPDRPFIVLSFGNTPETTFEDSDPFPYDLSDEELVSEVKYSLGIEAYPWS